MPRRVHIADVTYLRPGAGMYVGDVPGPLRLWPGGAIVGEGAGDCVPGGSAGMYGNGAENTRPPEASGACPRSSPVSKSASGGRAR